MFNCINKIKNRKGFTLVELLVVLAVLAIISAIAIPRFAGVQDSAKVKADDETINMVQKSLELWVASEQVPSPGTKAVVITVTKGSATTASTAYNTTYNIAGYLDISKIKLQKYVSAVFEINTDGSIIQTVVKTPTPAGP